MNKELTPLRALKELKNRYGKSFSIQDDNRMRIVENALKRLKELDSLYTLTNHNGKFYVVIDKIEFNQMLKQIKALEIIKDKTKPKTVVLGDKPYFRIWEQKSFYELTQEEHDLLKEML